MADKNDGSKTEKPTPKRLKDARKKGDVAKSKDLTGLVILLYFLGFFYFSASFIFEKLSLLISNSLQFHDRDLTTALKSIGYQSAIELTILSAILILPIAVVGLVTTFLQIGPVFTFEKIMPKMEHFNPAAGIKRMFSIDNLVEVLKSVAKTIVIFIIAWLIVKYYSSEIINLLLGTGKNVADAFWTSAFNFCLYTAIVFSLISCLDAIYQRFSFIKKMRMSLRDIKQEHKDMEGDPLLKSERQRLQREWAENSSRQATMGANVLLVNPTHLAIAIQYDKEVEPVPRIVAKGEDELAASMRDVASEYHIPILRNIEITRRLYSQVEINQFVPKDFFDVIAEVLLWAKNVKEKMDVGNQKNNAFSTPGEDLTTY